MTFAFIKQLLAGAWAEVGYPVRAMDDGETLEMGEVRFKLMHTPGHTPEHISLLITDRLRGVISAAACRPRSATNGA